MLLDEEISFLNIIINRFRSFILYFPLKQFLSTNLELVFSGISWIECANLVAILRMSCDICRHEQSDSRWKTTFVVEGNDGRAFPPRDIAKERKGRDRASRNDVVVVLLRTVNTPALSEAGTVVIVKFFSCRHPARIFPRGQGGCGQDFNVPKCRNIIRANVYRAHFVHPVNDHLATAFLRRRDYIFPAYLEIILFATAVDIFMNLGASV